MDTRASGSAGQPLRLFIVVFIDFITFYGDCKFTSCGYDKNPIFFESVNQTMINTEPTSTSFRKRNQQIKIFANHEMKTVL